MLDRRNFTLLLAFATFSFAFSVLTHISVAGVTYLGTDSDTQGDWIGVYGAAGAIIFCNNANHGGNFDAPYQPSEDEGKFERGMIEEINATDFDVPAYGWIWAANPARYHPPCVRGKDRSSSHQPWVRSGGPSCIWYPQQKYSFGVV